MRHEWGRREVHIELWWGNRREREHVEDLSVEGEYY